MMNQSLLSGTLLVALGLLGLTNCSYSADFSVSVVEPAVNNYMILQDGPLPPVCKKTNGIRLRACRGEYEPASFVVSASRRLEGVQVEIGQLRGPSREWPMDAVDVRVVKDYYSHEFLSDKRATMPLLLVHDENFLTIEPAPTKENPKMMKNAVRGELLDAPTLQPVTIEKRKQFWITVHVPEDAIPGTYKTTIKINSRDGGAFTIPLAVDVYPFVLLQPMIEYSIYYPTYLAAQGLAPQRFGEVTEEQMRLEFRNMLAHGLTNPNIYQGPEVRKDGSIDYTTLERVLAIRESVGIRPKTLYLVAHPLMFTDRPLTESERNKNHRLVREINAWAKVRGYEVYFAASDEWWGEQLSKERDSMISVREAGGKVFVSAMDPADFYSRVGDILDRPILQAAGLEAMQMAATGLTPQQAIARLADFAQTGSFEKMRVSDEFRRAIDGLHRQGRKIYTYMNPIAGLPMPEYQRRCEGLGMWRVGFDGTMDWSYIHIQGDPVDQSLFFAMAYRTQNGVLDTPYWEGYREGVDDVRYLTTLMDSLNKARGRFPNDPLVHKTDEWINNMDAVKGDLDSIRREMASRIVALSDLGYKDIPKEKLLAGIDPSRVKITQFPEPWKFKMDPTSAGVKGKWFAPGLNDSKWGTLRTDNGIKGWGSDIGSGWYRARLPLTPAEAKGKRFHYLYFAACDEDTWVYVNGKQLLEHSYETTGLLPSKIWTTPFSVPLDGAGLKGGDLLAVRVYNRGSMGGIWKPVYLITSDKKLTKQQVLTVMEMRGKR